VASNRGGSGAAAQRALQQRQAQQQERARLQRVRQDQDRLLHQQRQAQQRRVGSGAQPRVTRTVVQRQSVQQQRSVEMRRQQSQRLRIWRRTAAKRAARQVETELAIRDRERRLSEWEAQQTRVDRGNREAESRTAAVTERVAVLDSLWAAALAHPLRVDLDALRRRVDIGPFDPGGLDVAARPPRREDFEPRNPLLPLWMPGQRAAWDKARAAAEETYRRALAAHEAAERDRLRALVAKKKEYVHRQAVAITEVEAHNSALSRLDAAVRARRPDAVEEFARLALSRRSWPPVFPVATRLRYRPEYVQLDVERELPGPAVVPVTRRFRYLPDRDAIGRQPVPEAELRARYAGVVAQTALCVLLDLFGALAPEAVDVIAFNGWVAAAGEARPHLISLAVSRAEWGALAITDRDPMELLQDLDAIVSPDPYTVVPIRPLAPFEPAA